MENLNSADASLAQFHPEISGEHGPFPAPHLSRLWHRTRGGGNRKCVRGRGSVGFCHQQWSKSYSETSEPNQSISPEGFLESEQRWWKALRDKQRMGGRRWMTNFHISLSHSLPLFPLFLFYLSSLFHPPCGLLPLWLASAGKKSWSLVLAGNPQHAHCLLWLGLVKGALCSRDDTGFLPVFFTPKSNWPFPAVLHLLWRK